VSGRNSTTAAFARKSRGASRQVRLSLRYVSVWSATRIAFLCGVGFGLVSGVVTLILWAVLSQFGVFAQLSVLLSGTSTGSGASGGFGFAQALGVAVIVGFLNGLGVTLFGIVGSAVYNFGVRVMGGAALGFSDES
jgi:hypothetical protein